MFVFLAFFGTVNATNLFNFYSNKLWNKITEALNFVHFIFLISIKLTKKFVLCTVVMVSTLEKDL